MAKKATSNKLGRPPESPNKNYDVVDAVETACLRCGSTERAPYDAKVDRQPLQNVHVSPKTGRQFNVLEFRTTRCLGCNQARRDRSEIL